MYFDVSPAPRGWVRPSTPTILDLHSFPGFEAKLIHVLLGLSDIFEINSGSKVIQKINWAILGKTTPRRDKNAIKRELANQTIDSEGLNVYLTRNLNQSDLFKELFDEYARFFYYSSKGRHVQGFLHIYRILERISYSFPILYAARSNDYKGTFAELRGFITSPKDGELAFFRKFLNKFIDNSILKTAIKLDISSNQISNRPQHFNTLKSLLLPKYITNESADAWIEINQEKVLDVLITLRNRYFHFMSGNDDNLTGNDLPDPDEFFKVINPIFINWITYIYFRIIEELH